MRRQWPVLLLLLLLAGGARHAQCHPDQFGWGSKQRSGWSPFGQIPVKDVRDSSSSSSLWQQPITVSINPETPMPTPVPPLPPNTPAPTNFTLPSSTAASSSSSSGPLQQVTAGQVDVMTDPGMSVDIFTNAPGAGSDSSSSRAAPGITRTISPPGALRSSSSGSMGSATRGSGVTEVLTQTGVTGTTVKVLSGQQGGSSSSSLGPEPAVTIIAISPGGPGVSVGNQGLQRLKPGQQQQQGLSDAALPALDDLQPGDLDDDQQQQQQLEQPSLGVLDGATAAAGPVTQQGQASLEKPGRRPPMMVPVGAASPAQQGAKQGGSPGGKKQQAVSSKQQQGGIDDTAAAAADDGGGNGGGYQALQPPQPLLKPTQGQKQKPQGKQQQQLQKGPWGAGASRPNTKGPWNKPCGCPSFKFNFVCGSDGLTYANPCMAQCAGAAVAYMGPCELSSAAKAAQSSTAPPATPSSSLGGTGTGSSGFGSGIGSSSGGVANSGASSFGVGSSSSGSTGTMGPPPTTTIGSSSDGSSGGVTGGGSGSGFSQQQQRPAANEADEDAMPAGDYEYYYDDGRPPVPAPARPNMPGGAVAGGPLPPDGPMPAQAPAPMPVPIPAQPLPAPVPVPAQPLPLAGAPPRPSGSGSSSGSGSEQDDEEEDLGPEDSGGATPPAPPSVMGPSPPQTRPFPLPAVFGPEPIPEDVAQGPVPAPMPIVLTPPPPGAAGTPPRGNRPQGSWPTQQMPAQQLPTGPGRSPGRPAGGAPGFAPGDFGAGGFGLQPGLQQPAAGSSSWPPGMAAGVNAADVQVPQPWVFEQPGATDTVLFGCILPFEGDLRLAGKSVYHALKLAIMEEAPQVLPGVNVNLTCINTKCSDIPSHNAMNQLADEGAVAVVGEICSGATVAAAGVSTTRNIPLISPAATSPALSGEDLFFRTVPSDKFQGHAAANLMIKKGFRNVALVYEDAPYGYGLAFNFMAAFTKQGGNVPVVVMFQKNKGKPKQDVLQIKADVEAKNLDSVFMATNNLTYAAAFLRAADNQKLELPLFAGDALADSMMVALLKDQPTALKNLSVTTVNKGKNPFIRRFRAAFPSVMYGSFAAQGYDAMVALLRAYAAAPPPRDGVALAQELQQLEFEGVSGPIAFDKNGDAVPHNRTYMWVKHNTTTGVPVVKGYIQRK